MTPVCYVAGPMTGIPGFNYAAFDHARDVLDDEGWEVISPADLDRKNLGIDFSQMAGDEDLSIYRTEFARQDMAALLEVHTVFVLDGWKESTGAKNEMTMAAMLGVPIVSFTTRDPIAWEAHFSNAPKPVDANTWEPSIWRATGGRIVETRVVDADTGGAKGSKLARFDLIPASALWAVAEHFGRGAEKYEARNWERGYAWSLSYAALCRHLFAWWSGEDNDPELGSCHLDAVAFHALALRTFVETHPEKDDRPK